MNPLKTIYCGNCKQIKELHSYYDFRDLTDEKEQEYQSGWNDCLEEIIKNIGGYDSNRIVAD